MNRLFFTGDTHMGNDINHLSNELFPTGKTLDKSDIVVICGDAGFVWKYGRVPSGHERHWRSWITNKPWTTFAVLGNHENYDLIKTFPIVKFCGAPAYKITNSLYYAISGNIYNLNGHSCLCVNGADSTDRESRTEGFDWWRDERIKPEEINFALQNLKACDNKVDFVLSHTGGVVVSKKLGFRPTPSDYLLHDLLSQVTYEKHFCGHYHIDVNIEAKTKDRILFYDMVEVFNDNSYKVVEEN